MENFKKECKKLYAPMYHNNDSAHRYDHAEDVMKLALTINAKMDWGIDPRLIIVAASLHDAFTDDRKHHHILGYEFVISHRDAILDTFSEEDIVLIATAIKEHRGSFKGVLSSTLSDCISAADRGPCDFDIMFERSLKYNKGNVDEVNKHLIEKFGYGGYAKYPDSYQTIFKKELKILKDRIETLK